MGSKVQVVAGIEAVEQSLKFFRNVDGDAPKAGWITTIMPELSISAYNTAAANPSVTFRMTVNNHHLNASGNMHGGCTSTIFDVCTTMVLGLVSKPGFWQMMGVSRTLNCTYLRPIPNGSTIDIECDILHIGKRMCVLRGTMRSVPADGKGEGDVLAVCEHGKVSVDPKM